MGIKTKNLINFILQKRACQGISSAEKSLDKTRAKTKRKSDKRFKYTIISFSTVSFSESKTVTLSALRQIQRAT